jgi:MFS family permease
MNKGKNYKWEVLALLWLAFFINQADRQAFNVLLPLLKSDLGLSDVEIGTIATIFNVFYAFLVPIAGYIGDLYSRKWIVVCSILFWSIATMFTGVANTVFMLVIVRSIATGGGEAFFGPANYTLLAGYHKKTRGLAMSIHQTSYYLGIILSGFLAGYLGQRWGWRETFYVFGGVGLLYGLVMMFRLKDAPSDSGEKTTVKKVRFSEALRVLFHIPTAVALTIGFSGLIFVLVGYLTWAPTYLYENFSMDLTRAGFNSMFYVHIFAFAGILIAGKYSDRVAAKKPAGRLIMQGVGLLCAAPFIILLSKAHVLVLIYVGFAGFGFARSFFDANTYSVLYDVIPRKFQSSASGVMLMIGFGVGSLSPLILGSLKPAMGLSFGFSLLAFVWIFCGALLLVAARFWFAKDYQRARCEDLACAVTAEEV